MIIKIAKDNQVIGQFSGTLSVEQQVSKMFFEVKAVPERQKGKVLYFNPQTLEFYFVDASINESLKAKYEAQKVKKAAEAKKASALNWLSENDWKVNKRALGEWSEDDPRWIEYLTKRAEIRAQYDEAVAVLTQD